MALAHDILTALNNEDEPLIKRLRLADNVFKSTDLSLGRRESLLFKWVLEFNSRNANDKLKQFYEWINSDQFRLLSRIDFNHEDVKDILEEIRKYLMPNDDSSSSLNKYIIDSTYLILQHTAVQHYFKYNLNDYCTFIADIINFMDDDQILPFLCNENTLNRALINEEKFYKHFLQKCIPAFIQVLMKNKNEIVFNEFCKIIQKCIFNRNSKKFEFYLDQVFQLTDNTEKYVVPKALFKMVSSFYNKEEDEARVAYKLILQSMCISFNDFGIIFKSTVLFVETLGFKCQESLNLQRTSKLQNQNVELRKSLVILSEILSILKSRPIILAQTIKDLSFGTFIENIMKTVVYLTQAPNNYSYEILLIIIEINPLVIESNINEVLTYSMLADNTSIESEYKRFLKAIFEVYSKLHRIQNLISRMIPTLKQSLEENIIYKKGYDFEGTIGNVSIKKKENKMDLILPETVLNYFTQCVTELASWQVINLLKTLIFHLSAAMDNFSEIDEGSHKVIYIELVCKLTSWVLCSVRMAEQTISATVIDKFVNGMNELKLILGKFGEALLNQKHNHILMRAYLNLCYYWADMYSILCFYSINNEVTLKRHLDNDNSASNLTYLHSYLSVEQWFLISERIANFGETPCKLVMQKLLVQKIKSIALFEKSVPDDILNPVLTYIYSNVDDNWVDLIKDKFIINRLIQNMNFEIVLFIADHLVTREFENFSNMDIIFDSPILLNTIVYVILSKINKAFKQKRKHDQTVLEKPLCVKVFSAIDKELFYEPNFERKKCIESLKCVVETGMSDENAILELTVNTDKVENSLNLLKRIPFIFLSSEVQECVLLYLFSLHQSLMKNILVRDACEKIIIGMINDSKFNLSEIFELGSLIKYVIKNVTGCEILFPLISDNIFKQENSIKLFKTGVDYLTQNLKTSETIRYTIIVLYDLQKVKKSKMSKEVKNVCAEYKANIFNKIVKLVSKKDAESDLVEIYSLALKNYINQDENDSLSKLLIKLNDYVQNILLKDCNILPPGCIILFSTILHNKQILNKVNSDFTSIIWNFCKSKITSNEISEFSLLLVLIFEHIPNDDFPSITEDLLKITRSAIDNNDDNLRKHLNTWTAVLPCSFNPVKAKTWQDALETLLISLYPLLNSIEYSRELFDTVMEFETGIIKNHQLLLTPSMIGILLMRVTNTLLKKVDNFHHVFTNCTNYLELLLKYRNSLIMDRLPPYLKQFRVLLNSLCARCTPQPDVELTEIEQLSDCAHQLEKLTNHLVACNKHMGRIAHYLIADILNQYERVTLYPNVKIHLNNCVYSLISLCDNHSVSFLMRVLSNASTEMFKILYKNYKNYYRFTGKV